MTASAARIPSTKWEIIVSFVDDVEPMSICFGTRQAAAEFREHRLKHASTKSISQPREVYSR